MKQGIHPQWQHDCVVTCSCGNTFTTGATVKTLQVDICSACHPFFTGEMKFVDRQGRVDKFKKRQKAAAKAKKVQQAKVKKTQSSNEPKKSYKQILREQQEEMKAAAKAKTAVKVEAKTEANAEK